MTIRKHSRFLLALVFVLLFLVGLFTAPHYGLYLDQQSEANILRANMKEYAYSLLGADSEPVRYYDSVSQPRIVETPELDHGMAAFYPLAPFMLRMDTDQASLFPLWNGLAWCWFMAGVLALFGLCRKLGMSLWPALLGALLLYLCPRFFAEGHYNNKDMVLLSLTLITMFFGVRLWEMPTIGRGLVFAFFGALCTNTKIIGLCIFGVMGLCAVLVLTARKQWCKGTIAATIVTLLSFCLFYALLTPAMWQSPAEYFRYLIANATNFTRWNNNILFRGAIFCHSENPLPFYYLPYYIGATTPVYVLFLAVAGHLLALRHCWKVRKTLLTDHTALLLLSATLIWAAPLLFAMFSNPVVYNGWRHFYFVFAGLVVLAAWGLECLIRFLKAHGKHWQQITAAVLAGLCFLTSAVGIALNHPYQYGYFNAVGKALNPTPLQEGMELDYWCVSLLDALEEAVQQMDAEQPITFTSMDPVTYLALELYSEALPPTLQGKLQLMDMCTPDADLLVINLAYQEMYGKPIPEDHVLASEISSYGSAMMRVYRKGE